MMRLGRRASLLVAFSLLTSAATAHAECAWVLWLGERDTAVIQTAFPSAGECKAAAEKMRREFQGVRLELKCLPDTVDPRRVKGK
jgi:hypothetical protein